ncbi:MAG: hypothetical protein LAT77_10230 [Aliidiomarina sp.]|uniref:hypothetical protein n=1 Tax=Aliidiomarina sp. TaxID=1872439 RepID=UPI0025C5AEAD|nr:hypothetical protein [Aliidiomarina sp.]MCH8502271.1 hypothetical protein [Aliidiomarina sp.]
MQRICFTFLFLIYLLPIQALADAEPITLRHAIIDYRDGNYESAYDQMLKYLPLGSPDAAYYLGVFSIEELGTDYDPVKSVGYLRAAKAWRHQSAEDLLVQIEPHLSAEELDAAEAFYTMLKDELIVARSPSWLELRDREYRPARRRAQPEYPPHYDRQGMQTWVNIVQVVSKRGHVLASTVLNEPMTDFTRNYRRVENQFRYPAADQIQYTRVLLDYRLDLNTAEELKVIQASLDRALPLAEAGVPEQQMFLGGLAMTRDRNNEPYPMLADYRPWVWYDRAARGGYQPAQHFMALQFFSQTWAQYLIDQGDLTVMTFYGAQLHNLAADDAERARGLQLLEQAAAAGDERAVAILADIRS